MDESLITLFGIYFLSMFKFIAGPLLGSAAGYNLWQIILVSVSGTMTSVLLFTLLGKRFKRVLKLRIKKKSPIFSKKSRSIVRIWSKYGEIGIAFFSPIIFTPVGGTLILVSFGTKKQKIYLHMFWSALFWSVIFGLSIEHILQIPFFSHLLR